MKIWRHYLTETRALRCADAAGEPVETLFRVTAGSGVSADEARERIEAIFAELADWNSKAGRRDKGQIAAHRRRLAELHGWIEDGEYARPICEQVVRELDSGNVVTRNRYGAEVLNSEDVCFIDVDHVRRTPREFWRMLFSGRRSAEDLLVARMEAALALPENADLGFRLYRTAAGFRLIAGGKRLEPDGPRARELMDFFNSDRLYANLCASQKCYRARLTPKPSRIHAGRYTGEASWVVDYDRRRQGHAVCRFVCARGRQLNDPAISLHDERTMCESDLPLA